MKHALVPSALIRWSSPAHRRVGALLVLATAIVGLTGCTTPAQQAQAMDSTKYTLESTERFVTGDHPTQQAISCTGLLDHPLADGHMEVVANLRNRENRKVVAEANCVFRDAQGMTVEETPWQTVTLPENATVAVRFAAGQASAANTTYSVRVRNAH